MPSANDHPTIIPHETSLQDSSFAWRPRTRRGTRSGAIAGLVAGLLTVCLFPPLSELLLGKEHGINLLTAKRQSLLDTGFCGIVVNVLVFALVSLCTKKLDPAHTTAFARDLSKTQAPNTDLKPSS